MAKCLLGELALKRLLYLIMERLHFSITCHAMWAEVDLNAMKTLAPEFNLSPFSSELDAQLLCNGVID